MTIEKNQTTFIFQEDKGITVVPVDAALFIANDSSDTVNVRLKASRKNILTFNYQSVTNYTASSAVDFVNKIIA